MRPQNCIVMRFSPLKLYIAIYNIPTRDTDGDARGINRTEKLLQQPPASPVSDEMSRYVSRCSRPAVASLGVAARRARRASAQQLQQRGLSAGAGAGAGPLAGLTVLDCGNFLAGPIVSLHLSALGADVIKVEKPSGGDDGRAVGPFASDGSSSYHLSTNRGKRSIVVDTRTETGRAVFLDLAAKADILCVAAAVASLARLRTRSLDRCLRSTVLNGINCSPLLLTG